MFSKGTSKGMIFLFLPFLFISGCQDKKEQLNAKTKSSYSVTLIAKVKDLSAPVIKCSSNINIHIGEKLNWDERIRIEDNLDQSPTYKIEGKVNIEQIGEYPVTIVAKDDSGNINIKKITIFVSKKEETIKDSKNEIDEMPNKTKIPNAGTNNQSSITPKPATPLENKFFPFREGVSRDVVYQECMNYIATQLANSSGIGYCIVVDDNNGIHIGYQAQY